MDKCYRCNEVISMCPCDESTYTADDEISRLRAERDQLLARIEDTDSACADYAFAGAHTAREIIEKLHDRIRGYKTDRDLLAEANDQLHAELAELRDKLKVCFPLLDEVGLDEEIHCCEWILQQERKRLHAALREGGE